MILIELCPNHSEMTLIGTPAANARVAHPPDARYFVGLLDRLGYDAELKVVTTPRYNATINSPSQHMQIGPAAWASDDLAESGFLPSLVACDGSFNLSQFCDPEIDARMRKATRLGTTDPQQSHELWSQIEHDLVDQAPLVPLVNPIWTGVVSERLGNYQFHPYWGQLFDQMWVR